MVHLSKGWVGASIHVPDALASLCMYPIHAFLYKTTVYLGFYLSAILVNPCFAFCRAPLTVSGGNAGMCSSVTLELVFK